MGDEIERLSNGDIVTGGHTVAGVVNWDFLAIKVKVLLLSILTLLSISIRRLFRLLL